MLHLHLNNERGRPKSTRGPEKFCAEQIGASKKWEGSTILSMRRLSAMLLMVCFSALLIAPAAFTNSESQLPDCCRRLGKHHCATGRAQTQQESSGASFRTTGDACPYFPAGPVVSGHRYTPLLNSVQIDVTSPSTQPGGQVQTEVSPDDWFSRSHQKRGPPALIS
jgi:hypothetical protein